MATQQGKAGNRRGRPRALPSVQRECRGVCGWGGWAPQPPPGQGPATGPGAAAPPAAGGLSRASSSRGKILTVIFYDHIDIKAHTIQRGFLLISLLVPICFPLILKEMKIRALSWVAGGIPDPGSVPTVPDGTAARNPGHSCPGSQSCFSPALLGWPRALCTPQSTCSPPAPLICLATTGREQKGEGASSHPE